MSSSLILILKDSRIYTTLDSFFHSLHLHLCFIQRGFKWATVRTLFIFWVMKIQFCGTFQIFKAKTSVCCSVGAEHEARALSWIAVELEVNWIVCYLTVGVLGCNSSLLQVHIGLDDSHQQPGLNLLSGRWASRSHVTNRLTQIDWYSVV